MKRQSEKRELNRSTEVAGTGFTVLDRVFADGDLAGETLGGTCGNVLISLALLQRNVTPLLALGDDNEGERLVVEFLEAGASTEHIHLRKDHRSPILIQILDTQQGRHEFSFICPELNVSLPRYQSINERELTPAISMLATCAIFYADRLSVSILEAMKTAWSADAIIFFEPSEIEDDDLYLEALSMVSILKYSADRLGDVEGHEHYKNVKIVTHGSAGLEISDSFSRVWCEAVQASSVIDTCGSGDMVSVGLIDWLLAKNLDISSLELDNLIDGVVAGQHLAAENCAYTGARGIFAKRGSRFAKEILHGSWSFD